MCKSDHRPDSFKRQFDGLGSLQGPLTRSRNTKYQRVAEFYPAGEARSRPPLLLSLTLTPLLPHSPTPPLPYFLSYPCAALSTVASSKCLPISINPTGSPSALPQGIEMAGWPVTSNGQVLLMLPSAD